MRRSLVFAFFALVLPLPLTAVEIEVQGILVPRDVYVGDEALLTAELPLIQGGIPPGERMEIPPSAAGEQVSAAFTIRGGELSRDDGGTYHLALRFTPWEPGLLTLPPLNLGSDITLIIAPVTIASLSEKFGETHVRPARPPAAVPGTTYLLLGGIASLVLFLGLGAAAWVKGDALGRIVKARLGALVFTRAGRRTLRAFAALGKKADAMSVPDFAAFIEQNLRTYLEKRFRRPFTAMTAPELGSAFYTIFGTAADSFLDEQTVLLHRIFLRCDFLRYSAAGDSLPLGERRELIAEASAAVTAFERGPH